MAKEENALVRETLVCPRCGMKILFCRMDIKQFRCACGRVFSSHPQEMQEK